VLEMKKRQRRLPHSKNPRPKGLRYSVIPHNYLFSRLPEP
jgi:hypothetical protein